MAKRGVHRTYFGRGAHKAYAGRALHRTYVDRALHRAYVGKKFHRAYVGREKNVSENIEKKGIVVVVVADNYPWGRNKMKMASGNEKEA